MPYYRLGVVSNVHAGIVPLLLPAKESRSCPRRGSADCNIADPHPFTPEAAMLVLLPMSMWKAHVHGAGICISLWQDECGNRFWKRIGWN